MPRNRPEAADGPPPAQQEPASPVPPAEQPGPDVATAERLERLQEVAAALADATTPEEVAAVVVQQALGVTRGDAATVALVPRGGGTIEFVHQVGHDPAVMARYRRMDLALSAPVTDVARTGRAVWIEHPGQWAAYPHLEEAVRADGSAAAAFVPLGAHRATIGTLGLSFRVPRAFDPGERAFLRALGHLCGAALERARLLAAERRERAILDAVFAAVPVGLAFLGPDLRYRRVNAALAELNARPPAEHLGRTPAELFGPPGEPLEALLRRALEAGRAPPPFAVSTATPGSDGPLHLRISVFPVHVDGHVVGIGGAVVDLTEVKRAGDALRHANEELRRLGEQRTLLMQTLSHELKNPLLTLGLEAHLLEGPLPDAERARSVASLQRNIERLQSLARDLGEVARLHGGQLPLERQPVSLRWMLREALDRHARSAEHAGLDLRWEETPGDATVLADPRRVAQVLDNLLGNALKFTPSGGEVVVTLDDEGRAGVVRIRDSGPGLDEAQRTRLFAPFTRLHPEARKKGTGLGLYITKAIVEQHGGNVWAESEGPGRGSTFAFRLPAADPGTPGRRG